MEAWQRIGVYAAGLALTDAGIAKNTEILDKADMIVAAGGGERDVAVDAAILTDVRKTEKRDAFVNERLMSDLRPTLFLAQLPNLLAGNISLVHGVVGSSRTFMGEEASGVDALRVAHARIAAGQSEISLVGGAYNGTRWDLVLLFRLGTPLLEAPFKPVWDRGPNGALALAAMGAFVVIESREHAEKRGAKPLARLASVQSSRNLRKAGRIRNDPARRIGRRSTSSVKNDCAVVISGASGAEPATSEEKKVLSETGLPVRATATYIGNGMEAQFLANIALGCQAVRKGTLFPASGSGDTGDAPGQGHSPGARHQRRSLARRRPGADGTGRLKGERMAASRRDKQGTSGRRRHRHGHRHPARQRQGRQLEETDRRRIRHPLDHPLSDRRTAHHHRRARSITCSKTAWFVGAVRKARAACRQRGDRGIRHRLEGTIFPAPSFSPSRRSKSNGRSAIALAEASGANDKIEYGDLVRVGGEAGIPFLL